MTNCYMQKHARQGFVMLNVQYFGSVIRGQLVQEDTRFHDSIFITFSIAHVKERNIHNHMAKKDSFLWKQCMSKWKLLY